MGKPPWLSKTVLAIILLACCPSFARAQDADVAESYEDIVLKIKSASTANETRVRVALVPGRRYSIADSLTSGGLDALVLEGIPSNNPDDLPVLECTDGASVLVSNASTIVLANVRVEGCTGPAVLLQSPIDAGVQRPVNWTLSNVAFAGNLAQVRGASTGRPGVCVPVQCLRCGIRVRPFPTASPPRNCRARRCGQHSRAL